MGDLFTVIGSLEELVEKTSTAYSYDRYGRQNWSDITAWLLSFEKYTPADVEVILRSKDMRWCADAEEDTSLEFFKGYYARNEASIDRMVQSYYG